MTSTNAGHRENRNAATNYRVHFVGGATVTLKATNSLKAEQDAIRLHAGMVRKVVFLGKARQ